MEARLTCSICQEIFSRPVETSPCEHYFCEDCLKQWLETSQTCPECRTLVTDAQPKRAIASLVDAFLQERPNRQVSTAATAARQMGYTPREVLIPGAAGTSHFGSDEEHITITNQSPGNIPFTAEAQSPPTQPSRRRSSSPDYVRLVEEWIHDERQSMPERYPDGDVARRTDSRAPTATRHVPQPRGDLVAANTTMVLRNSGLVDVPHPSSRSRNDRAQHLLDIAGFWQGYGWQGRRL